MNEVKQEGALRGFFRKHLGWVVTGFLTLLFWMQTCNYKQQIREGKQEISKLQLDKQVLTDKVNTQGKTIHTQSAILVDNTSALNKLTDSIFKLKKKDQKNTETIAYFKEHTNTSVSEVPVPFLDTAGMKHWEDSVLLANKLDTSKFIRVPKTAVLQTKDLDFMATVNKNDLKIDHLSIPDDLNLRFVQHKGKLFKPSSIEVQFTHSNKYIQSLSANSVFYRPKKPSFLKRIVLPVAVGVGAGLLIAK